MNVSQKGECFMNSSNKCVYPAWFQDNEKDLAEKLQEMIWHPEKTITNPLFTKDQFMRYNPETYRFEYEDGAYLGDTIMDVIRLLHDIKYVCDTEWTFRT